VVPSTAEISLRSPLGLAILRHHFKAENDKVNYDVNIPDGLYRVVTPKLQRTEKYRVQTGSCSLQGIDQDFVPALSNECAADWINISLTPRETRIVSDSYHVFALACALKLVQQPKIRLEQVEAPLSPAVSKLCTSPLPQKWKEPADLVESLFSVLNSTRQVYVKLIGLR